MSFWPAEVLPSYDGRHQLADDHILEARAREDGVDLLFGELETNSQQSLKGHSFTDHM